MEEHHRYFLQYMLKNGVSSVSNAQKYCKHVSKGEMETMTHLKSMIVTINREISKHFFKIVFNTCEVTNQEQLVWLNSKSDEISRLQNIYTAAELEYFHAIMQEILNNDDHRITFIVCINITSTLKSTFSRDSGQKVLKKWYNVGYFVRKGEHIHFGPRLILEFNSYLKTHKPDMLCNLCSELVFVGKQCFSCSKTLHSYCMDKYLGNQRDCPCCHSPWTINERDTECSEYHEQMVTDESENTNLVINTGRTMNRQDSNDEDITNSPGPSWMCSN